MVLIPEDMDVPLSRRDTNKPENVRWLVRNLPIRNSKHPSFDDVWRVLKLLVRGKPSRF